MSEPTPDPSTESALCCVCTVYHPDGKAYPPRVGGVCHVCVTRMETALTELPAMYALVSIDPVRGTSEIRTRAFESRPPVNIDALSLSGPGWDTPGAILRSFVVDWSQRWADRGGELPGDTVRESCRWLRARLNWACYYPDIRRFAGLLRELVGELRRYAVPTGQPVGQCPRTMPNGDACGTELFAEPGDLKARDDKGDDPAVIECSRCHAKWYRKKGGWLKLGAQQESAGVRRGPKPRAEVAA